MSILKKDENGTWMIDQEESQRIDREYKQEQSDKFKALLASSYQPKNFIEKQLFKKAKEYAAYQLEWMANGAKEEEGGSAEYDQWLEGFLTQCGIPEDNSVEVDFDLRKPYPAHAFCRDSFTVFGFYEMTVDALIELADALSEDWSDEPAHAWNAKHLHGGSKTPPKLSSVAESILSTTEDEVDPTIHHFLFPTEETMVENEEVNHVIQQLSESKNPMQRLFSLVLLCAVEQGKYAFLFTRDNFAELLEQNNLIDRKTINGDYKKLLAYALPKGWLKIEVDYEAGSRKGRLISLAGAMRELIRINIDEKVDETIAGIVANYNERNVKKAKKVVEPKPQKQAIAGSDLDLCNMAMNLSTRFNTIDQDMIPGIVAKVNKYGQFKSDSQRNVIVKFLEKQGVFNA